MSRIMSKPCGVAGLLLAAAELLEDLRRWPRWRPRRGGGFRRRLLGHGRSPVVVGDLVVFDLIVHASAPMPCSASSWARKRSDLQGVLAVADAVAALHDRYVVDHRLDRARRHASGMMSPTFRLTISPQRDVAVAERRDQFHLGQSATAASACRSSAGRRPPVRCASCCRARRGSVRSSSRECRGASRPNCRRIRW